MTPPYGAAAEPHPSSGWTDAVTALREDLRPRAVQVANDVLSAALRGRRHSLPVRAHAPHGHVHVSDVVIIGAVQRRIDTHVTGAATGSVVLTVGRDEALSAVTVELFVQYGRVLMDIADQARAEVHHTLGDLLAAPTVAVEVVAMHVHISDVTVGDPALSQPGED